MAISGLTGRANPFPIWSDIVQTQGSFFWLRIGQTFRWTILSTRPQLTVRQ